MSLTGCSYDRAFMNMDSNSGSPFFGFQWAVDSGSRPSDKTTESLRDNPAAGRNRYPAIPNHSESTSDSPSTILLTGSAGSVRHGFQPTSEMRDLNTNVRYTLQAPVTDASLSTQSVDLRLSAF